jgi:[ribosomal protein S5]-alanine N-acetyltransferase
MSACSTVHTVARLLCLPARSALPVWIFRSTLQSIYEFGVHLRPAFWRRGFAKEAAKVIIEYGFEVLGAETLFAGHHPANNASRKLLLSLGFVPSHEELYRLTGLMHPSYLLRKPQMDDV